jgi:hypothetical protein
MLSTFDKGAPVNAYRPSALATTGYLVVTAILVFVLALGVLRTASTVASGLGSDGQLDVATTVPRSDVRSPLLGPGVEPSGDLPVTVTIERPTSLQILLAVAKDLAPLLIGLAAIWLVWGVARSTRVSDPFGAANVRRLRLLAFLILVGATVLPLLGSGLQDALFSTANATGSRLEDGAVGTGGVAFSTAPLVAGLLVLVLAEVFAHGVRLREDVEATV